MQQQIGGRASASGDLAITHHRPEGPGLLWRLKNFRHWWRGFWRKEAARLMGIPTMIGEVSIKVIKATGEIIDYGVVSYRVVSTAYVTALATNQFDGSAPAPTAFDYHDCGTGTNAEAAGDTALQTPYGGARTNGTPTNPSAGVYRNTGTINFTGTLAITEHGVFSAISAGTLLDRSVFSAVNVINGDAISFQYSLTYAAGG
jgi:hypothetical protein